MVGLCGPGTHKLSSSFSPFLSFSIFQPLPRTRLSKLRYGGEVSGLVREDRGLLSSRRRLHGVVHEQDRLLYDKVTVLESEKRAWENSPEAQAVREALNPWTNHDAEAKQNS
ncbi:uncharacterized protein LOC130134558 [Syzygium oleosum]|uniref:uncharacterized protein LOC130134558 n=1 Tax=Syzygium oleosum TaxID=219896 RepID=UPI0024BB0990|nr:uncharacterized protein LOC130134558 [Syzygium oleosum]